MTDSIENPLNGQESAPDKSKRAIARKPKAKTKSKSKKEKKRDSHAGRPKSSLTYWIKAIEGNRLRGPELAEAIRKVEEYEAQKLSRKVAFPSGFPVDASPEVQASWMRRFGHKRGQNRSSLVRREPIASQPDSNSEDTESEPARPIHARPAPVPIKMPERVEAELAAVEVKKKKAELDASAFLNQAEWDKYKRARAEYFSCRYVLPSGRVVCADLTQFSMHDPFMVANSVPVQVKHRPTDTAVLIEEDQYLRYVEPTPKPKEVLPPPGFRLQAVGYVPGR